MSNIETTDAEPDSGEREKIRFRGNSGGSEDEPIPTICANPSNEPSERAGWSRGAVQVVRHRTPIKNKEHAILHAHLIPKGPHADLFNVRVSAPLARQPATMSGSRSSGMCANSIGSPRI